MYMCSHSPFDTPTSPEASTGLASDLATPFRFICTTHAKLNDIFNVVKPDASSGVRMSKSTMHKPQSRHLIIA